MSNHLGDLSFTAFALMLLVYFSLSKPQRIGLFSLFLIVTVAIHFGMVLQKILR